MLSSHLYAEGQPARLGWMKMLGSVVPQQGRPTIVRAGTSSVSLLAVWGGLLDWITSGAALRQLQDSSNTSSLSTTNEIDCALKISV